MQHKFFQINKNSFQEFGVSNHKELWEKVKSNHTGFSMGVETKFEQKKVDGEPANRFRVIMSTATEDRHGDVVEQDWDLEAFKKNPVFLDSHNYWSIEFIIGKFIDGTVAVINNRLEGEVEFMLDNPKGLLAYKMASQGFLNATSVGFIPKAFDNEGRILKSELLENSAVSVPANAEALFEKSIDGAEIKSEDGREDGATVETPTDAEEAKPDEIADATTADEDTTTAEEVDKPEEKENNTEDQPEEKKDLMKEVGNVFDTLNEKKKNTLVQIIRNLDNMTSQNKDEKVRKIYKDVRALF